jgi:assimilatory nitrate reductase catalytic subunit
MAEDVRTTCPYCGVGCGVIASRDDAGEVAVRGDPDHPANFGRLCSKGSALAETLSLDGRLLYPEIGGKRANWNDALDLVARTFADTIQAHGPDSVAFYVSGQCLTEDYYVANKLMKGFIGSANIDTNSRLCMASSVAGHRRAFGSDTVPVTYEDLELADLIVLAGSNMAWCHPVLYQRIAAEKARRPGLKIVVIDPRRTMTCDIADLHLAIRPDSDVALFNGLFAHLVESPAFAQEWVAKHTSGLREALQTARSIHRSDVAKQTGLRPDQVESFFALFAATDRTVTCYSQGVNQSAAGTDKVNAILNCHLATGRIGRPGMGPFSLTGQPNAMGGREVGGMANMLAAHMDIDNGSHRETVRAFWNAPALAAKPGLKAVEMFRAVADGRIKAIWIMATNPVVSMPEADAVRDALRQCPFVVVSDIERNTDTARLAHVLLPALGWGEKDGTVTNSERRISRQRPFFQPPGEAMADWRQMAEVGRRMGFAGAFDFASPAEVFAEHAALSAFRNDGSRDFDIGVHAAITEAEYEALLPFQWPQRMNATTHEERFFKDGGFFTQDKRARFVSTLPKTPARDAEFPLVLNTGRIRDQWHTMTRTGKSARLSSHFAEPFAEINPDDAAEAGIRDADLVGISTRHGIITVRALLTDRQARGSIFVPMHWNDQTALTARVGTLITGNVDIFSGQPALKQTYAAIRKDNFAAYGFAALATRPTGPDADYWALARAQAGWRLEFGLRRAPEDWIAYIREAFGLSAQDDPVCLADRTTGQAAYAFFSGDQLIAAIFLARGPVAVSRNWVLQQLAEPHDDLRKRLAVVAGRAGAGQPDAGATVCSCHSIGANQIAAAVRAGASTVAAIGACLNAGTNCGSCRAEIKTIIDSYRVQAAE